MGPWAGQLLFVKQSKTGALTLPDTLRTKLLTGAEHCWSREIRWPLLRSKRPPGLHLCRKAPWRSKGRGHQPIIGAVKPPTTLYAGIHVGKKTHTHVGECPKNLPAMRQSWVWSLRWEIPGKGNGNPLRYSCLENPVGQRSLVGYSPWDHKESDTTGRLTFSLSLFHAGECPRAGQIREENPDNGPKVSKDPEELPCIPDLTASLLHSSLGKMPTTLSLLRCISALLLS